MADMYTTSNNNNNHVTACSSSTSPPPSPPPENDDISLFVRQILLRTTNSSSTSPAFCNKTMQSFDHFPPNHQYPHQQLLPDPTRVSATGSSFPVNVGSVGGGDNDFEEYDCENEEEGYEGLIEEEPAKASSRNSSKRSRAAEVHNLSEKRRRSRINEKMKALQNLIPNSNKTDKASMLDEAIEYLKQLQLQVQMLTMRNGLSVYPMCIPGVLQPNQLSQIRTSFHEGNEPLKMTSTPPVINPVRSTNLSLPNQFNNLEQPFPLGTSLSTFISSKTPFRLESSAHAHHKPFELHTYSEGNCREDSHFQTLNVDQSKTNIGMPKDLLTGVIPTSSFLFDYQASSSKDKAVESSNHRRI